MKTPFLQILACLWLGLFGTLTHLYAGAPVNDQCRNATLIRDGNTYPGTLKGATLDYAPTCNVTNDRPGVWYKCVGTGNPLTVSLCGSAGFDSKISVYSGTCSRLVCVDGNDDFPGCAGNTSEVTFSTRSGVTYYVLVHGEVLSDGSFVLSVTNGRVVAPPANDFCTNALPISCGQKVLANTAAATADGNTAPVCNLPIGGTVDPIGPGVWYTVQGNGQLMRASTCSPLTTFDTQLSVYEGDCNSLLCRTTSDDKCGLQAEAQWRAINGVTYYLLVHGAGQDTGTFELSLECFNRPVNDDPCNATPTQVGNTYPFDITYATADTGEANPEAGSAAGGTFQTCNATDGWCSFEARVQNSVWFTVVVPPTGCLKVLANGFGTTDTQLALYRVSDCGNYATYEEVAANDDSGEFFDPPGTGQSGALNFLPCLTPGETIYIQVDGFNGQPGDGELVVLDCGGAALDVQTSGCQTRFLNYFSMEGDTNFLRATTTGGYPPVSLFWQSAEGVLYENLDSGAIAVQPTITTDYVAIAIDSGGCIVTDTLTVVVEDVLCDSTPEGTPGYTMCCRTQTTGPVTIDFNTDAYGNPLMPGTVMSSQYIGRGITISAVSNGNYDLPILFDSSNPTPGDEDLGTPNQAFGGPGIGAGGNPSNNRAFGNLLIIAENDLDANNDNLIDVPDDEANGGSLIITFECPVTLDSITVVDMDDGLISGNTMVCSGPAGITVYTIGGYGQNSVVTLPIGQENVDMVEVFFNGSGGLAQFQYTSEGGQVCVDSSQVDSLLALEGEIQYSLGSCTNVCEGENIYFPPPPTCEWLTITTLGDVFSGQQTVWQIKDLTTGLYVQPATPVVDLEVYTDSFCVNPSHCYEFWIKDNGDLLGDGFALGGYYQLTFLGDTVFSNFFPLTLPYPEEKHILGEACAGKKLPGTQAPAVESPETVWLEAFPNPVREFATLRFSLPETGIATVQVFDLAGNQVAHLFQGTLGAEELKEVRWEPGTLAAGLYLLRLQSDTGHSAYRKLSVGK